MTTTHGVLTGFVCFALIGATLELQRQEEMEMMEQQMMMRRRAPPRVGGEAPPPSPEQVCFNIMDAYHIQLQICNY